MIKGGRGRRTISKLVPRHVICVGVRDKASRLPTPIIERKVDGSQL
jgi:hypothetical protein